MTPANSEIFSKNRYQHAAPWVRWSELPAGYRDIIKPTCYSYHIFFEDRYFGRNELDISELIMYTEADKWLEKKKGFTSSSNHHILRI